MDLIRARQKTDIFLGISPGKSLGRALAPFNSPRLPLCQDSCPVNRESKFGKQGAAKELENASLQ
uniref:Uncharacterized protein n=1 Tax=Candidatus Kentrum sp. SD TaxID=2126332 RepID=A0A451BSW0_9GAMM|nr:MAG: hypothetical protein BECKSD772D_GA0070982_13471 [Candidatus Kentron sp. SD]